MSTEEKDKNTEVNDEDEPLDEITTNKLKNLGVDETLFSEPRQQNKTQQRGKQGKKNKKAQDFMEYAKDKGIDLKLQYEDNNQGNYDKTFTKNQNTYKEGKYQNSGGNFQKGTYGNKQNFIQNNRHNNSNNEQNYTENQSELRNEKNLNNLQKDENGNNQNYKNNSNRFQNNNEYNNKNYSNNNQFNKYPSNTGNKFDSMNKGNQMNNLGMGISGMGMQMNMQFNPLLIQEMNMQRMKAMQNYQNQNQFIPQQMNNPYVMPFNYNANMMNKEQKYDESIFQSLEFYFSPENLNRDTFIRSNLDTEGFLDSIKLVNFNKMKLLGVTVDKIKDILKNYNSTVIESRIDKEGKVYLRNKDWDNIKNILQPLEVLLSFNKQMQSGMNTMNYFNMPNNYYNQNPYQNIDGMQYQMNTGNTNNMNVNINMNENPNNMYDQYAMQMYMMQRGMNNNANQFNTMSISNQRYEEENDKYV